MLLNINVLYIILKKCKIIFWRRADFHGSILIKIENMVIQQNKFTSLERVKVRKCDPDPRRKFVKWASASVNLVIYGIKN